MMAGGGDFANAMRVTWWNRPRPCAKSRMEALAAAQPEFVSTLAEVPAGPMLLVANEYLDCLPARQFRRDGSNWRECVIGLDADRELAFGLAADEQAAPGRCRRRQRCGGSPDRHGPAGCRSRHPRCALPGLVHRLWPVGRRTGRQPPFVPRMASRCPPRIAWRVDLTVDVDFGRLARMSAKAGAGCCRAAPQGMFLLASARRRGSISWSRQTRMMAKPSSMPPSA